MRRRALLATLGGTATVGLAGCTGTLPLSSSEDSLPESRSGGEPDGWPDGDAYFGAEQVVGYGAVDPEEADVYLAPSAESVADGSSIEFTLHSAGDESFETNFYAWRLFKHVDGEWFHVGPELKRQPLMSLAPGETHTWTLTVDSAGIEDGEPVPYVSGTEDLTFAGLGGGHYAFTAPGWFEGESHESMMAVAARFELDADAIQLTPTNAVEETTREDDALVATTDRGGWDGSRPAAYEFERVGESSGEPTARITEQVLRNNQLRDALALAHDHGADRVRIEEGTGHHPLFGVDAPRQYEYQGSYYRVTTRKLDSS